MHFKFSFDSDHFGAEFCNRIEVEIRVFAPNEDDAYYEIESIWDKDADIQRSLESFPENERKRIEETAEALANDNAHEVYYEAQRAKAEDYYDLLMER